MCELEAVYAANRVMGFSMINETRREDPITKRDYLGISSACQVDWDL